MKVYFLGTGTSQGIPVIGSTHPVCQSTDLKDKRLRVSIWISWDDYSYVIDCGPDFRQQILISNCQKVDGILFTHEHADHTAGLDDIRPFNFKMGAMPIYAHERVIDNLETCSTRSHDTECNNDKPTDLIEYTLETCTLKLRKDLREAIVR